MRKFFLLFLMLCFGFSISYATYVRVKVDNAKYSGSGTAGYFVGGVEMSDMPELVSAKLENNAKRAKEIAVGKTLPGGDGEVMSNYGNQSINIRLVDDNNPNGSRVILNVYKDIKNVNIYYSGSGNQDRNIMLLDENDVSLNPVYKARTLLSDKEYAHLSTVSNLPPGTYYLYAKGYTGGFIGIRFESADVPKPDSDEQCELTSISESTTWDFTDLTGTYDKNNSEGFKTYAYYYKEGLLSYNSLFAGNSLAFEGEAPLKRDSSNNPYAQNGTLMFTTTVDGVLRVSFTDTGTGSSDSAVKRYLAVNDEKTDYWTSRKNTGSDGYDARLNVVSEYIPVKAGDVYISGVKEDGITPIALRVYKVEFIKTEAEGENSIVGVTNDTFSQRIYYFENGKSASKWVYRGFKHTTHGLVGGVDDNGILYVSSDIYDPDDKPDSNDTNTNGNIMFYTPSGNITSHWLSCSYNSAIYLPVNEGTSGTITITCLQSDYNHKGQQGDRYFELQKEGKTGVIGHLPMRLTSSLHYKPENISTINGKSYVKLVSHYDPTYKSPNEFYYRGEMKVYTFTVVMDKTEGVDCVYSMEELEKDYDHDIGPEHIHAVFNWTQGTASTTGYHYGTLSMPNGSLLIGKNESAQGSTSGTETIHSYRNGDIVKYKNKYYGGLQLLKDPAVYTIKAPEGYYITTSTRIHGLYNKNITDTGDDNLGHNAYISNFAGGEFAGDNHDNSYIRFPRDDKNARTTTLDFTVTATESLDFQVAGEQIFGVIDAVLVPKKDVPTLGGKVFYNLQGTYNNVDVNDYSHLYINGTITYVPQGDEELWWYYEPLDKIESRGCFSYTSNEDLDKYPAESEGVKDQNFTKKFSVLNYKFVNTPGLEVKDVKLKTLNPIYDNKGYYFPEDSSANPNPDSPENPDADQDSDSTEDIALARSNVSALADNPNGVTIKVTDPGKYYFYIRDPNNNYNSVLAIKTFEIATGIEGVTGENTDETGEHNAPIYNLDGKRVDSTYRGIVIKNGKKYIQN